MENEKIKILHVLGGLNLGGAETFVMNFYKNIDKSKFQFDFVVHGNDKGIYEEEIEKNGGTIYHIPKYKVYNHFVYKKSWNELLKKYSDYKIIHGHVRSTASIYLKIAKKYGLKTICHSHSISNGTSVVAIFKNILQFRIRYIADYFMGCSYEANRWLFGKKIANSNRCFIVNNAINYDKFKFNNKYRNLIRDYYNIKENEIILGHIGRFTKAKNHKYLLDIFSNLVEKNDIFKLMLCGSGELEENIKLYARKKYIENKIIFISSTTEVYKYYSTFDIFLFPSKYEGLGIAAIEAQVSGLPVILSSNIPKNVDITNKTIFLDIDYSNISDWIENIILISKKINIDNRENIKVLDNFDIKNEIKKLENLYIKIC